MNKPPIVEALVDIGFSVQAAEVTGAIESQWDGLLSVLSSTLKGPDRVDTINHSFSVKDGSHSTSTTLENAGARFRSEDGSEVVFVRRNGFTFSQVRGYTTWDALIDRAKNYWELVSASFPELNVERVSTRFVNVVSRPQMSVTDVMEKLTFGPSAPDAFAMRPIRHVYQADFNADEWTTVRLVQLLNPMDDGGGCQLVLDIAVVDEYHSTEAGGPWHRAETLRRHKNDVFFASFDETASEWFS